MSTKVGSSASNDDDGWADKKEEKKVVVKAAGKGLGDLRVSQNFRLVALSKAPF